jgi:hypothetical protein
MVALEMQLLLLEHVLVCKFGGGVRHVVNIGGLFFIDCIMLIIL